MPDGDGRLDVASCRLDGKWSGFADQRFEESVCGEDHIDLSKLKMVEVTSEELEEDDQFLEILVDLVPFNVYYAENKVHVEKKGKPVEKGGGKAEASGEDVEGTKEKKKKKKKGKKKKKSQRTGGLKRKSEGPDGDDEEKRAGNSELRARVQEKIAAMRKERKADDEGAIKRREFKREKNEKKNDKKRKTQTVDDPDMKKTSHKKPKLEKESSRGTGEPEASKNSRPAEDISFAPMAGLETGGKKNRVHMRKRDKLTHALEKAEKQQGDKSFEMEKMIKRAQGEKVLDDTKLLKKSLKSMDQKKLRSRKKWEQRIKQQKKNTADAQKKRQANIDTRKAAKASKTKTKQKKLKKRR
ncbi:hypothetical protein NDN08_002384 [Rhodosorus marinus]|uniref:Ribosomal RNA-processing protein 14/surfeit locus protein 6 C-terminal domain-containing protein n=1 Tax=Rhodosorus marinus TaxID=101924 RepID=A0AAV8UWF1_9RHOD|nr:hypothetical protein NDN08_002384 [Rhodosorus marinus]